MHALETFGSGARYSGVDGRRADFATIVALDERPCLGMFYCMGGRRKLRTGLDGGRSCCRQAGEETRTAQWRPDVAVDFVSEVTS